ncbi:Retrovirus-related Pol polyprotein from transposon TNT 1-94 [Gossypium australe]|uniref:Retrovirus-related Pol polyprotein from transposon TNT 1-94 n=1 Tax=Gossypium australe TaxID=47621 RepID=A0A5B6WM64_9ROSI|nr:Retrovirus-related Pol polyprotein from transposon TNT 1-94 [Gossypium australe]
MQIVFHLLQTKGFLAELSIQEPLTIKEAFINPEWTKAAQQEYDALLNNNTWKSVPFPPNRRAVDYKWICKLKKSANGTMARYKGRSETFSPMVKPTTIRVILTLGVTYSWKLRQVDINNASFNSDINEEIYMSQPSSFETHVGDQPLVCKLKKAFYGLNQAPRAWFHKLREYLVVIGCVLSKSSTSLFIKISSSLVLYVLVYVDDIIVTGNQSAYLHYFLGIEVFYTSNGLFLSQRKYILDLLKRCKMDHSNASPTLMVTYCTLSDHYGNLVKNDSEYRSTIGALQYIIIT